MLFAVGAFLSTVGPGISTDGGIEPSCRAVKKAGITIELTCITDGGGPILPLLSYRTLRTAH